MNNLSETCTRCNTINKLYKVINSVLQSFLDKYRYHLSKQQILKIQSWIDEHESNLSEEHSDTCTRYNTIDIINKVAHTAFKRYLDVYRFHLSKHEIQKLQSYIDELESDL